MSPFCDLTISQLHLPVLSDDWVVLSKLPFEPNMSSSWSLSCHSVASHDAKSCNSSINNIYMFMVFCLKSPSCIIYNLNKDICDRLLFLAFNSLTKKSFKYHMRDSRSTELGWMSWGWEVIGWEQLPWLSLRQSEGGHRNPSQPRGWSKNQGIEGCHNNKFLGFNYYEWITRADGR